MPIGPYEDFGECVSAQKSKGKSDESAKNICGFLEKKSGSLLQATEYDDCLAKAKKDYDLDPEAAARVCDVIKNPAEDKAEDKLEDDSGSSDQNDDTKTKDSSKDWFKSAEEAIDAVLLDAADIHPKQMDQCVAIKMKHDSALTKADARAECMDALKKGGSIKEASLKEAEEAIDEALKDAYRTAPSFGRGLGAPTGPPGGSKTDVNYGEGLGAPHVPGGGSAGDEAFGRGVSGPGPTPQLEARTEMHNPETGDRVNVHTSNGKTSMYSKGVPYHGVNNSHTDTVKKLGDKGYKATSHTEFGEKTGMGSGGEWVTINGHHVLIGGSLLEAADEAIDAVLSADLNMQNQFTDPGKLSEYNNDNPVDWNSDSEADYNEKSPDRKIDISYYDDDINNCIEDQTKNGLSVEDARKFCNSLPASMPGDTGVSDDQDIDSNSIGKLSSSLKEIPLLTEDELDILRDAAGRDTSGGGRHPDSGKYVTGHGENNLKHTPHSHGFGVDGPTFEGSDVPTLDDNAHIKKHHKVSHLVGFGGFGFTNPTGEDEPADQEEAEDAPSGPSSASIDDFMNETDDVDVGEIESASIEDVMKSIEELKSAWYSPDQTSMVEHDPLEGGDQDAPELGDAVGTDHEENSLDGEPHSHDFGVYGPKSDHFGNNIDEASHSDVDSYNTENNSNLDDNDHIDNQHPAHKGVADQLSDIPSDGGSMKDLGENKKPSVETQKSQSIGNAPTGASLKEAKPYPWDKCIEDNGGGEDAKKICGSIKAKYGSYDEFKEAILKKSTKSASLVNLHNDEHEGLLVRDESNAGWIKNGKTYSAVECEKDFGSDVDAKDICGYIAQHYGGSYDAYTKDMQIKPFEENNKFFIKAFLMDPSLNKNQWGVHNSTLDDNIRSYIGKPLVLQSNFDHPVSQDDNLQHQLEYQQLFSIGPIVDVVKKGTRYDAIAEITDHFAQKAFKEGDLPLYVSPQLYKMDATEKDGEMTKWQGTHLAIVKEPAFGVKLATVNGECTGDHDKCVSYLRKAAMIKDHGYGSCGFCNYKVLSSAKPKNDSASDEEASLKEAVVLGHDPKYPSTGLNPVLLNPTSPTVDKSPTGNAQYSVRLTSMGHEKTGDVKNVVTEGPQNGVYSTKVNGNSAYPTRDEKQRSYTGYPDIHDRIVADHKKQGYKELGGSRKRGYYGNTDEEHWVTINGRHILLGSYKEAESIEVDRDLAKLLIQSIS